MSKLGYVPLDLEGTHLTGEEIELLHHPVCVGVILFARNYHDPLQLKALTQAIYREKPSALIMVDQEGGRVQRFMKGFTRLPPMQYWGQYFDRSPEEAVKAFQEVVCIHMQELKDCGVNVCLSPVLDLNMGLNEVIAERSFHSEPEKIIHLARAMIEVMHGMHMPSVGKHFPGHGHVKADSHLSLPVDSRSLELITQNDLQPFMKLISLLDMVMPAHVVYQQCDEKSAGFSSFWLKNVLRHQLGFKGVIISDDLNMGATHSFGSETDRTQLALEAGCDLLLVCNNRKALVNVFECLESYHHAESDARIQRLIQM
ncbi:MAG TPA: beta-N-acetylhexosaminidase [Coxiellaceae bacterium]|nr:beta-N-acetylhexosaminidase [Coxiellaceae bacterium]